jgi:pimeloyl-ACP methyl ester carboxylesterase
MMDKRTYLLAITEPDLVGGVVSLDMAPYAIATEEDGATAAGFEPEARKVRDQLRSLTPEQMSADAKQKLATMVTDPAKAAALAEESGRSSPAALGEALYELWTMDLRPRVGAIRVPVLVLVAKDSVPPPEREAYVARWRAQLAPIAKHEMVMVPGARHYLMIDAPDVVARSIEQFLAAHR